MAFVFDYKETSGEEAMIKFYLSFGRIEEREVTRETDSSFFTLDRHRGKEVRHAKQTSWQSWHDTWEDAYACILADANKDVNHAKDRLATAENALRKVLKMKKP